MHPYLLDVYLLLHAAALAASLGIAVYVHRTRTVPGSRSFAFLMLAVGWWTFASIAEALSPTIGLKIVSSKLSYIGILSVGPAWILFVLQYLREDRWLTSAVRAAIWMIPAGLLALVMTNEWHGFVWRSVTPMTALWGTLAYYEHGPGVWISVVYSYALILLGSILLVVRTLRRQPLFRIQTMLLLVGIFIPWAGNALYVLRLGIFSAIDLTPVMFTVTGLLVGWSVYRFQLLDVAPIARDVLFASLADGVIVLDADNRIADANPAAQQLSQLPANALGSTFSDALPHWSDLAAKLLDQTNAALEHHFDGEGGRWIEFHVSPLFDRDRQFTGKLLVMRDITERKRIEHERERLVEELQTALDRVKTLHGLLPICSSCKKIRNDEGYWQQVDMYIVEHTEARITHGLCPDCLERLYPKYVKKRK